MERVAGVVAGNRVLAAVLNAAGISAMVINHQRQILFANDDMLELVGAESLEAMLGRLPGEAVGCVNADQPAGCGNAAACLDCSVRETVLACRDCGDSTDADCVLTVKRDHGDEALEFHIKASPLVLDGLALVVVTLRDISAERRRDVLERVFFHDILNTITGLDGHVRLLEEDPRAADAPDIVARVARICDRLRREVQDQRSLIEAEAGTLHPELREVDPAQILERVAQFFAGHVAVSGRTLELSYERELPRLVTDEALLIRVLINMVKNAFEATPPGGNIRLSGGVAGERCIFSVHNPGVMLEPVASQIFRRSFSTKGQRGRGLGTYSMKLLGERYLGGQVRFTTSQAAGTEFSISLPLRPARVRPEPR